MKGPHLSSSLTSRVTSYATAKGNDSQGLPHPSECCVFGGRSIGVIASIDFAVNVKNELTTAVGLTRTYDCSGNLTYRAYNATGPKSYTYVYDDENQFIELRTVTVYTAAAARLSTLWTYDGLGRVRVRTDYTWSGSAWAVSVTVRYLYDGMRVIQERNASNTPTVSYTRGRDLSGSLEGAGGIGGLLGRSHGYSSGTWSTHNHYHADGNGNVTFLVN
jgi:hypothetical protein